ncbi:MAG: hypothetical protein KDJ52_13005, partial [Anaerolineae bacterium]|nr:hypothetical protein [Anaerolineae bacterium]
ATWTPTLTSTPAPTKTPTETRTVTPTRTPSPSNTPTFTPTFTPEPPTPTPLPTSTPTPLPYVVASHSGTNNCADMALQGVVTNSDGLPARGVQIQYGEAGVDNSRFVTSTDANGRYTALLLRGTSRPAALETHTWYSYVLENGQQASRTFTFATDPLYADNPSYCYDTDDDDSDDDDNSDDDNSDDDDDSDDDSNSSNNDDLPPGCTLDPCKSSNSIQVKGINWQRRSDIPF